MPQTIDRKSASNLLGVSVRTIDRYIRSGKLFAKNQNGRILLDKSQLSKLGGSPSGPKISLRSIRTSPRNNERDTEHRIPVKLSTPKSAAPDFYRDLYDESRRALHDYHQKLEQANYRIGQLESQGVHQTPAANAAKSFERRDDFFSSDSVRQDSLRSDAFRREFTEKEKEIMLLKELAGKERTSRIVFAVLTYLLLGLLPLVWYLTK